MAIRKPDCPAFGCILCLGLKFCQNLVNLLNEALDYWFGFKIQTEVNSTRLDRLYICIKLSFKHEMV